MEASAIRLPPVTARRREPAGLSVRSRRTVATGVRLRRTDEDAEGGAHLHAPCGVAPRAGSSAAAGAVPAALRAHRGRAHRLYVRQLSQQRRGGLAAAVADGEGHL